MANLLVTYFDKFREWLTNIEASCTSATSRTWCMFGFDKAITFSELAKFFDRKDLNDQYIKKYVNKDIAKQQAFSHIQLEINAIYGIHKSFASRHKTRLQCYKDDLSQKTFRTKQAINLVDGKMRAFKTKLS